MKISGGKTFLVPFSDHHLNDPKYFSWVTDFEVMRFIGREEYLRPIRFQKVQEYVEALWEDRFSSFFAVHSIFDEQFIGTAKVSFQNESGLISQILDVGIMIGDKSLWGKGFATDVLKTVCLYSFDVLGARKLTAGASSGNPAVIKAFERIGFIKEGCLRKKLLQQGLFYDHILLGCFKEEFRPAFVEKAGV